MASVLRSCAFLLPYPTAWALNSYIFLLPSPTLCGSEPMHFYSRLLHSVAQNLCTFIAVSYILWLRTYAFLQPVSYILWPRTYAVLQPSPTSCGSEPMHFYSRLLHSVVQNLCIFTAVSYILWFRICAFSQPSPTLCGSEPMHFHSRPLCSVA
jgi:hypothetical protein